VGDAWWAAADISEGKEATGETEVMGHNGGGFDLDETVSDVGGCGADTAIGTDVVLVTEK
jgi:hypothetical protein